MLPFPEKDSLVDCVTLAKCQSSTLLTLKIHAAANVMILFRA